ncbi:MAG TPA: hypothetical protein VKR06_20440 [Ktedonosporobacter sp.]|nr:hypothetical protein [Ktedonosporobacter sp.]
MVLNGHLAPASMIRERKRRRLLRSSLIFNRKLSLPRQPIQSPLLNPYGHDHIQRPEGFSLVEKAVSHWWWRVDGSTWTAFLSQATARIGPLTP